MWITQEISHCVVDDKFYDFLVVVNVGPRMSNLGHLLKTHSKDGVEPVIVIEKRAFRCG